MTWFRVGGAGIPASLKNNMNSVLNKKFGTTGQNYPPNGWPDDVNLLGPLPEKTVAGAIAHTDDASDTVPVKSVICSIVPKQAGSGTPSPTNIRALSGYAALTASQRGKNLLDSSTGTGTGTIWFYYDNGFLLRKGVTYVFSCGNRGSGSISFYGIDHTTQLAYSYIDNSSASVTFTPTEDMYVCPRVYQVGLTPETVVEPQLEVGSSQTTFEAYNAAADVSDSWSSIGTIYGGERDLTEGTLKRDMTTGVMTSDYLSGLSSDYIGYTANVVQMGNHPCVWVRNWNYSIIAARKAGGVKSACNVFPISIHDSNIWSSQYRIYFDVDGTGIESVSDFISSIQTLEQGGTDLVIAYEMATPVDYSNLQTYDFETLYAVNNFYSDIEGGQTQITYRQDIALALAALQGSRSLSASLMRSGSPEEVSEPEENIQNTEEMEGESDER